MFLVDGARLEGLYAVDRIVGSISILFAILKLFSLKNFSII
tara:strand:- start:63 stop:185 length:123 start_codon:yes stop_codon:yes gene_type:complete